MAKVKKSLGVFQKIDWRSYGPAVIGVDEVGRGCLAGPVGAAACLFVKGDLENEVTDSKKLVEARREILFDQIRTVHPVGFGSATSEEVDQINILKASLLAMERAVRALEVSLEGTPMEEVVRSAIIVVDGNQKIPGLPASRQQTLIKGDLRCAPISAASIMAKVARDRLMKEQASLYPGYGFELHKGYGTVFHREAIQRKGPCPLHRLTFAGVK